VRLALVTDTYRPQVNGVVSTVDSIARAVGDEIEVRIFAPTNGDGEPMFRAVTFRPYPDYKIAVVRPETLTRRLIEEQIDLVHVHTPLSLCAACVVAARRLGIPVVGTYHTMISEYTHYVFRRCPVLLEGLAWRYASYFYRRCRVVTAPSRAVLEMLLENGVESVRLIPGFVDVDLFTPGPRRENDHNTVLFVGRLDREKRVETLIRAAVQVLKEIPRCEFRLVGTGVLEEHYRDLVRSMGMADNFTFDRFLDTEELVEAYRSCDVFVMPSDTETLGLVALEAMACGKPAVGADAWGLRDVITHNVDGLRFPPGDDAELAAQLVRLLGDGEMRLRMGLKAREKAKSFSYSRIGRRWVSLYNSVLEEARSVRNG